MDEKIVKCWLKESENVRLTQVATWLLEERKLRTKETNDLLARNGQLKRDAQHAAETILRLKKELAAMEKQRDTYKKKVEEEFRV